MKLDDIIRDIFDRCDHGRDFGSYFCSRKKDHYGPCALRHTFTFSPTFTIRIDY